LPLASFGAAGRRLVTIVFCDVTDSTGLAERLDPEALREVLSAHYERVREIVERHGGQVEKYIGDGILAVFGLPRVAEDDALRAVAAADELRRIDGELRVSVGVSSGEVVTGPGRTLGAGDPFITAARLEQLASSGEALMSQASYRLVGPAVEAETVGPLRVKGKRAPLTAYRLLAVTGDLTSLRRLDLPLVGRLREREILRTAFERAVDERDTQLVTLLGEAGIGKSRLLRDLLDGVAAQATVLFARCSPRGETSGRAPAMSLLGADAHPDTLETAELLAAVRARVEELASVGAVVVALDDVHWAERIVLDLVEHLAATISGKPLLIVCAARPQLLVEHPTWGAGAVAATVLELGPLDDADSVHLLAAVLGETPLDDVAERRILASAEGNPLFLEQLATSLVEGDGVIPPTLTALLGARLALLADDERRVLELAATAGRDVPMSALEALAGETADELEARLSRLASHGIVHPTADGYRFHHDLVRDSAYNAITKRRRADLHERYAGWVEATDHDAPEVVGHHLELAASCLDDIGLDPSRRDLLRSRAAAAFHRAGHRENDIGDAARALQLLERVESLVRDPSPAFLTDLGIALRGTGDLGKARTVLERAIAVADDDRSSARARAEVLSIHRALGDLPDIAERAAALVRDLESAGDELALALALQTLDNIDRSSVDTLERALRHARAAGARRAETEIMIDIGWGLNWSWTPTPQAIARVRSFLAEPGLSRRATSGLRCVEGALLTMLGEYEQAEAVLLEALAEYRELGREFGVDFVRDALAGNAFERGDVDRAEALYRQAITDSTARGERRRPASWRIALADCALARGDHRQARLELERSQPDVDPSSWHAALSHVLLFERDADEALAAARIAGETAALHAYWGVGQTQLALGRALIATGGRDAGIAALERSVDAYDRKECVARARETAAASLGLVRDGRWDGDPASLAAAV
jgi:class 3 adenylate cyclase/tetratricopeptide (TPR) repeat protein